MLELRSLSVGYGRTTVVHDVSLTVPERGRVAMMGHNGAGKTTLLRGIVGLLPPHSGAVLLDGEDVTSLPTHRRVERGLAYVPQGQQVFPQLTTRENLQLVADGRRRGSALVDDMLDLFPALRNLLERPAGLLSGGQRQQLSIARALMTEPRLLLLDEPTEGIQPSVVAEIEDTILELTSGGRMSLLLVEQHIHFALRAAETYHVLESGRVTASGAGGLGSEHEVREAMTI